MSHHPIPPPFRRLTAKVSHTNTHRHKRYPLPTYDNRFYESPVASHGVDPTTNTNATSRLTPHHHVIVEYKTTSYRNYPISNEPKTPTTTTSSTRRRRFQLYPPTIYAIGGWLMEEQQYAARRRTNKEKFYPATRVFNTHTVWTATEILLGEIASSTRVCVPPLESACSPDGCDACAHSPRPNVRVTSLQVHCVYPPQRFGWNRYYSVCECVQLIVHTVVGCLTGQPSILCTFLLYAATTRAKGVWRTTTRWLNQTTIGARLCIDEFKTT